MDFGTATIICHPFHQSSACEYLEILWWYMASLKVLGNPTKTFCFIQLPGVTRVYHMSLPVSLPQDHPSVSFQLGSFEVCRVVGGLQPRSISPVFFGTSQWISVTIDSLSYHLNIYVFIFVIFIYIYIHTSYTCSIYTYSYIYMYIYVYKS